MLAHGKTVEVFYDGDCPLCMREIRFLRGRDRQQRIAFEDISVPGFDPGRYGLDQATVMARIHGVLPDGTLVEGVEVFRQLYRQVGLGWLLAPTRWPLLRPIFDAAYVAFARNRLRITGRSEAACTHETCAPAERSPASRASGA
jgi:predicted DCC family thiol-disulfide oxidoreductase YuxK